MKFTSAILLFSSGAINFLQAAEIPQSKFQLCESTKEYITSYRYLESQKAFALKKDDIMKISDKISKGCSGAAKRFVDVNELLIKSSVETSDAIKIALKFTDKSDLMTEAFMTVFKETFLKEYLDLDLSDSIDFALKLALETEANPSIVKSDFQKIVKFCMSQSGLDLTGAKCSQMANKVVLAGAQFQMEMSPTFLGQYDYLTDKSGADLPTYKALELSLKLIEAGPKSVENFKDAYKFASSKTGLDLAKNEAINYAELMALRSKVELKK